MTIPTQADLLNQRCDQLLQRLEDARKAIVRLCERVSSLEEFSSLHHHAISHCSGGCKPELHRNTPFES